MKKHEIAKQKIQLIHKRYTRSYAMINCYSLQSLL